MNYIMSNIEVTSNTVFLCWFQGLDHLLKHGPSVNQTSWKLWNKLNPGNIILITDENLSHYAPETEKLRYVNNHPFCKISNLLRLELLSKYGGTWGDISILPTKSIADIRKKVLTENRDIFMYRFMPRSVGRDGKRDTSNWFITVKEKDNFLIKLWNEQYKKEFISGPFKIYFRMHHILCDLYDTNKDIRRIIESMERVSEHWPHRFLSERYKDNMEITSDDFMFKRPCNKGVQKILKYLE